MNIQEAYTDYEIDQIAIAIADYVQDYQICITFNDGTEKTIDFKPFLEKSVHPAIRKYLDLHKFKAFDIVNGNLNWNDYDMIFPLSDLYQGKIS